MSHLNGKKPFVGVEYIRKSDGRTISVTSSGPSMIYGRTLSGMNVSIGVEAFYQLYRRAPGQAGAKARKEQAEAAAAPRVKQSEFEND